jgi:hypothetical protein
MVFVLTLLVWVASSEASVRSKNGITFDHDSNHQSDMTLNTIGLGIGMTPSANLSVKGNVIMVNEGSVSEIYGRSTFELYGSLGYGIQDISSDQTLSGNSCLLVNPALNNGDITLTLPSPSISKGRMYMIKGVSHGNVFLSGNIDGYKGKYRMDHGSQNLSYPSLRILSNGMSWLNMGGAGHLVKDVRDLSAGSNLRLWLDGNDVDGDYRRDNKIHNSVISSWVNKANGKTATVTTGAPLYDSETLAGRGVMHFDGTSSLFTFGADYLYITGTEGMSIFAVLKPEGSGSTRLVLDFGAQSSDGYGFGLSTDNAFFYSSTMHGGATFSQTGTYGSAQFQLLEGNLIFGEQMMLYMNNALVRSEAVTIAALGDSQIIQSSVESNSYGPVSIGGQAKTFNRVSKSRFFKGRLAEILLFDAPLTGSERTEVNAYLSAKWNLSL